MKLIHTIWLMITAIMMGVRYGGRATLQTNDSAGTEGSLPGPITYIAAAEVAKGRFVMFDDEADGHDRKVKYPTAGGTVLGVTLGEAAAGEAVAIHVLGSTPGTVTVETTGDVARLDTLAVGVDGKGIEASDVAALNTKVLAAALEANDNNFEVEVVGNSANLFG